MKSAGLFRNIRVFPRRLPLLENIELRWTLVPTTDALFCATKRHDNGSISNSLSSLNELSACSIFSLFSLSRSLHAHDDRDYTPVFAVFGAPSSISLTCGKKVTTRKRLARVKDSLSFCASMDVTAVYATFVDGDRFNRYLQRTAFLSI